MKNMYFLDSSLVCRQSSLSRGIQYWNPLEREEHVLAVITANALLFCQFTSYDLDCTNNKIMNKNSQIMLFFVFWIILTVSSQLTQAEPVKIGKTKTFIDDTHFSLHFDTPQCRAECPHRIFLRRPCRYGTFRGN
jgi:hypothetical protein